jgi:hypothetical protein
MAKKLTCPRDIVRYCKRNILTRPCTKCRAWAGPGKCLVRDKAHRLPNSVGYLGPANAALCRRLLDEAKLPTGPELIAKVNAMQEPVPAPVSYVRLKAGDVRRAGDEWRTKGRQGEWRRCHEGFSITNTDAVLADYRRPVPSPTTKTPALPELVPCPFCRCRGLLLQHPEGYAVVICAGCGVGTTSLCESAGHAVAKWNRRAYTSDRCAKPAPAPVALRVVEFKSFLSGLVRTVRRNKGGIEVLHTDGVRWEPGSEYSPAFIVAAERALAEAERKRGA